MKKTIIAWLFSLLSGDEQKEITGNMLKASYPDHHLRHNPRKKEKTDESNRGGVPGAQEAGCESHSFLPAAAQVQGETF